MSSLSFLPPRSADAAGSHFIKFLSIVTKSSVASYVSLVGFFRGFFSFQCRYRQWAQFVLFFIWHFHSFAVRIIHGNSSYSVKSYNCVKASDKMEYCFWKMDKGRKEKQGNSQNMTFTSAFDRIIDRCGLIHAHHLWLTIMTLSNDCILPGKICFSNLKFQAENIILGLIFFSKPSTFMKRKIRDYWNNKNNPHSSSWALCRTYLYLNFFSNAFPFSYSH